jgi:hypothetical protein
MVFVALTLPACSSYKVATASGSPLVHTDQHRADISVAVVCQCCTSPVLDDYIVFL